jgi:hypothetical protein
LWIVLTLATVLLAIASEAQAQWRSVPFDSGNFTAGTGAMTWTVDESDQQTFKYVVNDRTMTVAVILNTTTVAGSASQYLWVKLPAGYRAGSATISPAFVRKDLGSPSVEVIYAATFPNDDRISLFRPTTAVHQLSTNATYVYFTITFDLCSDTPDSCP